MSSINLSDDLLNNFEDSIKSLIAFLLQDPCTGSSSAVTSTSTSEHNSAAVEQHMRRIYESANEIECNLLQLKALVNRTLPEEQILENITDLRTNIERKETLLREFNQYLNDAIADFSVENTESLNGLLDELSRGITTTSALTNVDLGDNLSQATTTASASQSSESINEIELGRRLQLILGCVMLRFTFYKHANYIRCSHVILQRFLSIQPSPKTNQTSALPVGTGLSTVQASNNLPILYEPSLISRIKMKLGLQAELREPQKVLYQAAAISFYMITSSVDFDAIQRELDMPDVFASFGRIIFLHVWFLLVRYVQLGPTGIFLRRQLARTMWTDLDLRAQQILPGQSKVRRSQLEELRSEMNAFMLALDEGLVDDDTVLAAAVWRHFRHFQPTRLENLVTLVTYIRKNIQHLEQLPDENFIKNGYVYFLPLHSDTVDTKFVNQHYLDFKNKARGFVRT
ncbi:unnamed protein product [Rotaria sp. Silwood1]|nr:unnamed protein product [Rotaria sp. Silwood1]